MTEQIYQINSPPMQMDKLQTTDLAQFLSDPMIKAALMRADEDYLHWDALRHKNWLPNRPNLDKELFWTLLRFHRAINAVNTPIKDSKGQHFIINTSHYNKFLHILDKEMAGDHIGIPELSEKDKQQFITRSIIEESIASSQLEGANTSRVVAKKMLLEGRRPNNHSEQMIVNNHKTMLKIEQVLYKEDLSLDLICELHSMITDQTIPNDKQGVLRETLDENGHQLVVKPWDDQIIAYITPDKEFVTAELPKLIAFANDKDDDQNSGKFIHPLIKAIMIHFWIGLLHPFEDGNGRLARVLFYWYMLKHDYWAFAYFSLSEKIKKSPKQYAFAYIYSEQESCDLTYFIHYNIQKIKLAQKDFQSYILQKIKANQTVIALSQQAYNFNQRQIKLLQYLNQKIEERTNLVAHMTLYSVKKLTAINDLNSLVQQGFLVKKKQGRNMYYYPTGQIKNIFKF